MYHHNYYISMQVERMVPKGKVPVSALTGMTKLRAVCDSLWQSVQSGAISIGPLFKYSAVKLIYRFFSA